MINKLLDTISIQYPLRTIEVGEFEALKISGMKFHIQQYTAEKLGNVSVMTASGFLGLMKMETLIINPFDVDAPILSYDRVKAFGNDTLIFELYDSFVLKPDLALLEIAKQDAKELPDHDLGEHWYDSIKLPESVSKKGKVHLHGAMFDDFAIKYLAAFLKVANKAFPCDSELKKSNAAYYVRGLLEHGGPSTDVFIRAIGRQKTETLFRKVLFALH